MFLLFANENLLTRASNLTDSNKFIYLVFASHLDRATLLYSPRSAFENARAHVYAISISDHN